ncbi:hypothetical protein [Streptomyces sp. NPDC008001]|uniref:hypothetical protein n=1 Tax=Streptomyces sp. NPDC008001 TaxID=3364804 RepID=UPI0036E7F19C
MNRQTFEGGVAALAQHKNRTGSLTVPWAHVETLPDGTEVKRGAPVEHQTWRAKLIAGKLMSAARTRMTATLVAVAASAMVFALASAAMADDHDHGHGLGPLPMAMAMAIVSPAPGEITKEHKVTDSYQYDAKGGSSSSPEQPPSSPTRRLPPAPEPGPLTSAKDTLNATAQTATAGASSTADSALK